VYLDRLPAYLTGCFLGLASKIEDLGGDKMEVEGPKDFLGDFGKELIKDK